MEGIGYQVDRITERPNGMSGTHCDPQKACPLKVGPQWGDQGCTQGNCPEDQWASLLARRTIHSLKSSAQVCQSPEAWGVCSEAVKMTSARFPRPTRPASVFWGIPEASRCFP